MNACAGAVWFNLHLKFIKTSSSKTADGVKEPAAKIMSFFKFSYPTEDVTDHEMNFRHLFPSFLLLKESLRKYYWPKSKPTSRRVMICLGMTRRRRMIQSQMAIRRSRKAMMRRMPPLEMVSFYVFFPHSTFVDIIWAILWLELNTNLRWVVQENTLKRLCMWRAVTFRLLKVLALSKFKCLVVQVCQQSVSKYCRAVVKWSFLDEMVHLWEIRTRICSRGGHHIWFLRWRAS